MSTLEGIRDGQTFNATFDLNRLKAQAKRVYTFMADNQWHTLAEISDATHDPESSVSARLRDLRKPRFGALTVNRRRRLQGTWEYQLAPEGMMF